MKLLKAEIDLSDLGHRAYLAIDTDSGRAVSEIPDTAAQLMHDRLEYMLEANECADCRELKQKHYKHAPRWANEGVLAAKPGDEKGGKLLYSATICGKAGGK